MDRHVIAIGGGGFGRNPGEGFIEQYILDQTNKEIPGEFLGRLVLGVEDNEIKIFGATIY